MSRRTGYAPTIASCLSKTTNYNEEYYAHTILAAPISYDNISQHPLALVFAIFMIKQQCAYPIQQFQSFGPSPF
jgi:hypothetical protein